MRTQRLLAWVEKDAKQRGVTVQEVEQEAVRSSGVLRMGEPEDIANLAAFVLSTEGSLLHGAIVDMDGGRIKTV
ncbi:putative 2,4-dienoyl-CoA reductase [compost metagenome]